MITYNLGDKFVIEIEQICKGENDREYPNMDNHLYKIKGFNSLAFDKAGLDKLQKYGTYKPSELEEFKKEAYNKGLQDAWEFIRKTRGLSAKKGKEIFGYSYMLDAIDHLTPQEVLAKLEAYEKEQDEIKVGDVLRNNNTPKTVVVTKIRDDRFGGFDKYGIPYGDLYIEHWHKTGKHIDISSILEKIGGGE